MPNVRSLWWLCAPVALASCCAPEQVRPACPGMAIYVAADGNDAWSGTAPTRDKSGAEGPFASLERARQAVRDMKKAAPLPDGGVSVIIRGGIYRLERTFELTEEDSGTESAPVTYRAAEGEQVRLVGGAAIPPEAFRPVTDAAVLVRLDEAARGKALQVDLGALGVGDFGKPFPTKFRGYAGWPELFFDRRPMQIARWPNEGFAKVAKVLERGSRPRWNEKPERPGKFRYEGDRPARWLTADEVYLNGYWCFKWFNECIKVAKIDPAEKSIAFAAPHVYGVGGPSGGFYFALNLLEELDRPGEYFLDRKTGVLYFWPPAAIEGKEIGISLLDAPMVSLKNTSCVTLRDLTFEFSRGIAVTINGGSRNLIAGCTIRNIATDAMKISGTDNGALSCDIYNVGGAGISLNGGDRATLTPCRNFAENCHIHHFGRLFRTHKDALYLGGVGCRASHNLIHDAPHHALDFGGNDHVIEFNEIHDVCTETDDAGSIYTGRDWTVRGTVIRHNFFHDIGGRAHVGNQAIYVDDNSCNVTSVGNVIYRVFRAFLIGGGRENVIENNVIVDCAIPVHIDNRGMSWSGKNTENWQTLTSRLNSVPYKEEPWRSRYPELTNILDDEPGMPKRNRVTRNLIIRCGGMGIAKEARETGTIRNNWETKDDPGFTGIDRMDFSLKSESPAFEHIDGFQPIPFDKIGLYRDEYRRALPVSKPCLAPDGTGFVDEVEVSIFPGIRSGDSRIHYTLDGSQPTTASPLYASPIRLTETTTITAAAFGPGGASECSEAVCATYTVHRFVPGQGIYLSDLAAADSFVHGGLKKDSDYAAEAPVKLGGRAYEKSIMIHPETTSQGGRSHVTYALKSGLERAKLLKAKIGVEDVVGKHGSVTFAVEVLRGGKWEQVYESGVIRGGDSPQEIAVDISGAEQLRLVCTDAGDNINSDHATWVDARLE